MNNMQGPQAEQPPENGRPRKRPKQHNPDQESGETRTGRQSKACASCRRLKVKCDWAECETSNCSRCSRLGLLCLRETRSWTSGDDAAWQTQLTITKLERALEDVLEKLEMPTLDLYVSPAIVGPHQPPRSTRHNSEDPVGHERNVSPAPMNSLIEVTQLNGMRSQLRSARQRRKGGMRRMDSDLISEKLITVEEAEQMLALFQKTNSHHLFSASISPDATLEDIRTSSTVLFTAIILVTALHMRGKELLHEMCHRRFMGLVSSVIFDRFHTLDDIRGLCIAAFWQPYLSWKISGLCIRMATELNLHHAFYDAFNEPEMSVETRKECLEKARLWYLLYVLDHQSSVTYGRPPVMSELRPIKDYEMLLNSEYCTPPDRALMSQVTGLLILSRAFALFGLEPKRTMGGDDASVLNHMRFTEDVQAWKDRWTKLRGIEASEATDLSRGVELHYHFSNLVLNSLVLRGRPLDTISELPASLRHSALKAVEAAHSILHHFLNEPIYREEIVGMPLYLHSMVAFAVVFLLKLSHRWHAIGITIGAAQRTIPLVEEIIKWLQGCEAGANHMVFSMARGFERMLRQVARNNRANTQHQFPAEQRQWADAESSQFMTTGNNLQYTDSMHSGSGNTSLVGPTGNVQVNYHSPNTTTSRVSNGDWGFQDEQLWSVGMGYDLLDPSGQGLADTDFPFQMYMYNDASLMPGLTPTSLP